MYPSILSPEKIMFDIFHLRSAIVKAMLGYLRTQMKRYPCNIRNKLEEEALENICIIKCVNL